MESGFRWFDVVRLFFNFDGGVEFGAGGDSEEGSEGFAVGSGGGEGDFGVGTDGDGGSRVVV